MDGSSASFVLGIDKPCGPSSHDVVNACRRVFGVKRVGHAGTLDPFASGVLIVCVGSATRLNNYFVAHDKGYDFEVRFGTQTDTDDCTGEVVASSDVPECVTDPDYAQGLLDTFLGKSQQQPPAYSAIKVNGVRSYKAARAGKGVELAARPIEIHAISLLDVVQLGDAVSWRVHADVSSGTYIRSLARDIGLAAQTHAHTCSLRRVRSGSVSVGSCVALDALSAGSAAGRLDPVDLLGILQTTPTAADLDLVANGAAIPVASRTYCGHQGSSDAVPGSGQARISQEGPAQDELVALLAKDELLAIYRRRGEQLVSDCNFATGVKRG